MVWSPDRWDRGDVPLLSHSKPATCHYSGETTDTFFFFSPRQIQSYCMFLVVHKPTGCPDGSLSQMLVGHFQVFVEEHLFHCIGAKSQSEFLKAPWQRTTSVRSHEFELAAIEPEININGLLDFICVCKTETLWCPHPPHPPHAEAGVVTQSVVSKPTYRLKDPVESEKKILWCECEGRSKVGFKCETWSLLTTFSVNSNHFKTESAADWCPDVNKSSEGPRRATWMFESLCERL